MLPSPSQGRRAGGEGRRRIPRLIKRIPYQFIERDADMNLVGTMAEGLARRTSRRETTKGLAAAAFGLVAAVATQGPFGSRALAARCAHISPYADCNPPYGRYCTTPEEGGESGNCDGSRCAGNCTLDTRYYPGSPQTGCWCTAARGPRNRRYYYKCCDCQCPDLDPAGPSNPQACGCRERVRVDR